jgi:hypothetical protein
VDLSNALVDALRASEADVIKADFRGLAISKRGAKIIGIRVP